MVHYIIRFSLLSPIFGLILACSGTSEITDKTNTPPTNGIQTTTDTTSPSKPGNLTTTSISSSFIQLSWSAASDNVAVTGYKIYRNSVLLDTVTQTTYLDTGVSNNSSYEYYVMAFDSANNTNTSTTIFITTPSITPTDSISPTVPGNLRASSSPTASNVNLIWDASTDNIAVSGYRVYRNNVLIDTTTSTTYQDSSVNENTDYTYNIYAFDAANNTSRSNDLTLNTPASPDNTKPTTPDSILVSYIDSNSIVFGWNAATDNVGVSHYLIYRNSAQIASVSGQTFTDNNVQPDTNYQYQVAAVDFAGNISSLSTVITINTLTNTTSSNFPDVLIPISYDCTSSDIHCVDDTSGSNQEFPSIQEAVDIASPGDTIIIHDGTYSGFTVSINSTTETNRLIITGNGNNVLINSGGNSEGRVLVSNSNYITIEGLTIEGGSSYCLAARDASADAPMIGVYFQFNTTSGGERSNIYMSHASYSLILGNITHDAGTSHGIYLSNAGSDNTIIKANRSYNNPKDGLHFNGDSNNGGDGIHSNIVIESNIFYNNQQSGVDADGLYDSVFINNLMYNNTRHGIRGFQIDSSAGVGRLHFVNNTLVNNGSWGIKLTEDTGNHVFFNNIIMNNANGCIASGHSNLATTSNIYNTGCLFSQDGEVSTISYSTWTFIYSDISIETSINDVMNNPGSNDYRLATNSPAIDNGINSLSTVQAPTRDIEGTARPEGMGIDIGVFESY